MYKYDAQNKVLKIQQIPEDDLEVALTAYQQESYKLFCEHTIFDRLKEFVDQLGQTIKHSVTIVPPIAVDTMEEVSRDKVLRERIMPHGFYLGTKPTSDWHRELRTMPDRYTPIMCNLDIDGAKHNVEIFRLPEMDADGILNIAGERRICNLRLTAADGVSYDGAVLGLSVPMRNISISINPSSIMVKTPHKSYSLVDIVYMYCAKEGYVGRVEDLFCSAYIKSIMAKNAGVNYEAVESKLEGNRIYDLYQSDPYRLGSVARDSLNTSLSISRAVGRVLSRDAIGLDGNVVPGLTAGTMITKENIKKAYRHLCNELYVQSMPDVVGYKVYDPAGCIIINRIPAGMSIPDKVRAYLPEQYKNLPAARKDIYLRSDADESFETEDVVVIAGDPYIIPTSETLSKDTLELLMALGYKELMVSRTADQWFTVTFEEEIIGNYTVKLSDYYGGLIPEDADGNAEDWIYYRNNPNLSPTPEANDLLNVDDWIGLLSLCSYVHRHPNDHMLVNKDTGMLKRIQGPNELFSSAFDTVFRSIFYANKSKWTSAANSHDSLMPIDLHPLFQSWRKTLWDKNIIVAASLQNPIIHTQQANLIDSAAGLKEVPNAMRMLSTGFYGRIDPYETPSSKRLGITSTCTIGTRIDPVTGIMKTRYLRVIKEYSGNKVTGCSIDPKVYRDMDAQEETQYRIGDKLSLQYTGGMSFKDSKVVARVPDGHNGHTIETVDAWSLDYVNFHSLQGLSVTSCLVPFIGADESARMTLATGMLKQSILVQYNEKPRIYTQMYRQLFEHSPTYCQRATKAGIVTDVLATHVTVSYPPAGYRHAFGTKLSGRQIHAVRQECAAWPSDVYNIQATTITRQSVNIINYHVKNGDWVNVGDMLYDSSVAKDGIYAPGCNFFAAYIPDGFNYEDAVEISESAASRFTSISLETQAISLPFKPDHSPICNARVNEYVWENQPIAEFQDKREGRTIKHTVTSGLHSGIVLDVVHDPTEVRGYSRHIAYMVGFNKLRTGDKLIGRHSNKGTASVVQKNSDMPRFLNGVPCDIVLNPMGVPSRLNIGQNYEGYLGFIAYLLDINIESDSFNGATKADIRELMHYVWELANNGSAKGVNSKYPMLPMELRAQGEARHAFIRQWEDCFFPDGTAMLINPVSGKPFANPVTFGMPYMLKLEHEVTRKIKARAGELEEDYTMIYQQPVEGASRGGGERVGEMEFTAYAAYGANELLSETMNEDSDNIIERLYSTMQDLGCAGDVRLRNPDGLFERNKAVPHAVEHLRYLLEALGISMDAEFLPGVSRAESMRRVIPDKRNFMRKSPESAEEEEQRRQDAFGIFSGSGGN